MFVWSVVLLGCTRTWTPEQNFSFLEVLLFTQKASARITRLFSIPSPKPLTLKYGTEKLRISRKGEASIVPLSR